MYRVRVFFRSLKRFWNRIKPWSVKPLSSQFELDSSACTLGASNFSYFTYFKCGCKIQTGPKCSLGYSDAFMSREPFKEHEICGTPEFCKKHEKINLVRELFRERSVIPRRHPYYTSILDFRHYQSAIEDISKDVEFYVKSKTIQKVASHGFKDKENDALVKFLNKM